MVLGADILNGIGDGHIGWYWGRTHQIVYSCPNDPLPLGVKRSGTKFEICRRQI